MAFPSASAGRLRARFLDREDLGRKGVIDTYWAHLPATPLDQLLDLIEVELSLSVGLLRPDDAIGKLTAPFSIENPLTWLWAEAALEDGVSELNYQFRKRLKAAGVKTVSPSAATIGQLVDLWCKSSA